MSVPTRRINRSQWAVIVALLLAVAAAGAVSLGMGAVTIDPAEVVGVLGRRIGLAVGDSPSDRADAVVWGIRMPRVLMAMVVGATLAATGAVLQGLFRNSLADPQLLAIGPGAALGAALGANSGIQGAIAGGVVAGLLTALLVRRFGRAGSDRPSRFILMGVALGAALGAWVGFVVFASDRTRVPPIEFWLLGGLSGSTWRAVGTVAMITLLTIGGLLLGSRSLDVMALGERDARNLGVQVDLATTIFLMVVGVAVGAAVGAVGVIGFVGLLVPHLVRRVTGPQMLPLLLAGALGGSLFLLLSDLFARTIVSPSEIPVGLVTAAVGGPFFLWLASRNRA